MDADVLIVGGGLVGASLACALSGQGLRLAMVEPYPFHSERPAGYDDRTIALAEGSRRVFQTLSIWEAVASEATPIRTIHVSERGAYGFTRLRAAEHGVEALGYVTPARSLGRALADRLADLSDLRLLSGASLVDLVTNGDRVQVQVEADGAPRFINASLVVAADGFRSTVRTLVGIDAREREYGQNAIIANITPELPHGNVAYERFTDQGPMALLPMSENRCGLVCTVEEQRAESLMRWADAHFLEFVQARFGDRLGRFLRVGQRQVYPLVHLKSREHFRDRVVIIGNAAHTLHPVAGQGFNLGLRDVAALAEVVCDAHRADRDIGGRSVLEAYQDWRGTDQTLTAGFTDALVRLFTNPLPPLKMARDLGLLALDVAPGLKQVLARNAMGLAGRLPKLTRGIAL